MWRQGWGTTPLSGLGAMDWVRAEETLGLMPRQGTPSGPLHRHVLFCWWGLLRTMGMSSSDEGWPHLFSCTCWQHGGCLSGDTHPLPLRQHGVFLGLPICGPVSVTGM